MGNISSPATNFVNSIQAGSGFVLGAKQDKLVYIFTNNNFLNDGKSNRTSATEKAYHNMLSESESGKYAAGDDFCVVVTSDQQAACVSFSEHADVKLCCTPPTSLSNVVEVSVRGKHCMALTGARKVVCWGNNDFGQCMIPSILSSSAVVAIKCGKVNSMALTNSKTIHVWGDDSFGQVSGVPPTAVNIVAMSTRGGEHLMCLSKDKIVSCWGRQSENQCDLPSEIQGWTVKIDAGDFFSLALTSKKVLHWWGSFFDSSSTTTETPLVVSPPQEKFIANVACFSAGNGHFLVLLTNRKTVLAFGRNDHGQCDIPDSIATCGGIAQVSAGTNFSSVLTKSGKVICWGRNRDVGH